MTGIQAASFAGAMPPAAHPSVTPSVRRSTSILYYSVAVPWLVLSQGASFEVKLSVHVGGSPGLADLALATNMLYLYPRAAAAPYVLKSGEAKQTQPRNAARSAAAAT